MRNGLQSSWFILAARGEDANVMLDHRTLLLVFCAGCWMQSGHSLTDDHSTGDGEGWGHHTLTLVTSDHSLLLAWQHTLHAGLNYREL